MAKLLQSEREKLLGLEDILHKSVVGTILLEGNNRMVGQSRSHR